MLRSDPIPRANIRSSTTKIVNLAVRGVPVELEEEEVKEQIKVNNEGALEGVQWSLLAGSQQTRRAQKTRSYKLTVPKQVAALLLNDGRLFLDMMTVSVEIWSPGHQRCLNCFAADHKAKYPKECSDIVCNTCAGSHRVSQCDKIDRPDLHKCVVCTKARKAHHHRASVRECPILKEEALKEMKKAAKSIHG